MADWSLLTNHARLLLAIENEPGLRVREMADRVRLSALERDLRRLISHQEWDALLQRWDALLANPCFPNLDPYRNVPWPPF